VLPDDNEPPDASTAYDADGIDRSLIRYCLSLTPDERLEQLEGFLEFIESARPVSDGDP
jgi:hypothetical protein